MKSIADLLFEANLLKQIPRSGYAFLGAGKESVAEHVFMTTFIGWILSAMVPEADGYRLLRMCLVHDLAEVRTGDLNTVNKLYVTADENRAAEDVEKGQPVEGPLTELLDEFNETETLEAKLARDADQLAFLVDLKRLKDVGYRSPDPWLPAVKDRIETEAGKRLADEIMEKHSDEWWQKKFIDTDK